MGLEGRKISKKIRAPLLADLSLVIAYTNLKAAEIQEGGAAKPVPVITRSFASTEIRPGETWQVYLKAFDPGADMEYILATV